MNMDNGTIISIVFGLIITLVGVGLPILIIGGLAFFAIRKRKRANFIMQNGIKGTARVLGMHSTGVTINNNPQVGLDLEVTIPNHPPYHVHKTVTVPIIYLPQIQTGSTLDIMVHPEKPADPGYLGITFK